MSRRSKCLWISVALLVVVLQAAMIFVVIPHGGSRLGWLYSANQYSDGYNQIAENLVEGNGYRFYPDTARTLSREPGYPLLLAGIFLAFGESFAAVKLINLLLGLAAACLMLQIARKFSQNRLLICAAVLLFLFHPGTLVAESRGSVEMLFAFMLTLFALTVYRAIERGRWQDYLLSGLVLGATVSVRSTPIVFPVLLLAYLLVFERGRMRTRALFGKIAIMIAAMFTVLAPWTIRNYSLTGEFIPTASVLGVAAQTGLYLSTHHQISGQPPVNRAAAFERDRLASDLGYHFESGYFQYFYSSRDEVNFSRYLLHRVMGAYEKSPLLFIKVVGSNLFNFWCYGKNWKSAALDAIVQIPFLGLAIAGVIVSLKNDQLRAVAPMILVAVCVVAVSLPILAMARYSVPLNPFLAILAAAALSAADKRLRRRSVGHDHGLDPAIEVFSTHS